ncbi:hypothetical protein COT52_00075 [candidate division WWE3 bacterium CG08_land_8_20_14_0_20_43_13]|uniref:Uncharacterized protein n=1 Tax=candidate division WWE3 bacterium CG08_land_8_20_14_0_20_43_13 TaxID=1975087 RepID=A0A2H0X8J5_UNCKA|nr:MAG: hypothetical protein COT52_00075 [candidate division WWE3 bacterium CG08_land_8_20_14_0_20_43_13]
MWLKIPSRWDEKDALFWGFGASSILLQNPQPLLEGKGVFLVPPRCPRDVFLNWPSLEYLGASGVERLMWGLGPVIGPPICVDGEVVGIIMFVPRTPNMIKKDPGGSLKLVQQCAQFARDLGAEWLATGAFLGSFVGLGRQLHVDGLKLTLGHSATVYLAVNILLGALRKVGLDPGRSVVAIAGAGGNIGRSLALQLAGRVGHLVLFDQLGGSIHRRMEQVAVTVRQSGTFVSVHSNGEGYGVLRVADGVVTALTDESQPLRAKDLKHGVVLLEDSQPEAMEPQEAEKLAIPRLGVVAKTPGVDANFTFQPDIGRTGINYPCLAELLACMKLGVSEGLTGTVTQESVDRVAELLIEAGYGQVVFHSDGRVVTESDWGRARQLIASRPTVEQKVPAVLESVKSLA